MASMTKLKRQWLKWDRYIDHGIRLCGENATATRGLLKAYNRLAAEHNKRVNRTGWCAVGTRGVGTRKGAKLESDLSGDGRPELTGSGRHVSNETLSARNLGDGAGTRDKN